MILLDGLILIRVFFGKYLGEWPKVSNYYSNFPYKGYNVAPIELMRMFSGLDTGIILLDQALYHLKLISVEIITSSIRLMMS